MKPLEVIRAGALAICLACGIAASAPPRPPLELDGFIDWTGAITVLHHGDFVDPYFAVQALLLAQDNGLDIAKPAGKWINWLLVRQKPDATFDRYCRSGSNWLDCKDTDADDAMLAQWLRLLDGMPMADRQQTAWKASHDRSVAALRGLRDPARGIFRVSPAFQEGLFMDNVEIWSLLATPSGTALDTDGDALGLAIEAAFWDRKKLRFLISTRPGEERLPESFYPIHVTQVLPLLFNYPYPAPIAPDAYYRQWMRQYRSEWLRQAKTDFAWGLLAVLALRRGDLESAACWRRETQAYRRTSHWTVTDEVAEQILSHNRIAPASSSVKC